MAAAVVGRNVVVGPLRPPKVSRSGLRCHDACLPPCVTATWSLTVVGERALSCRFKDLGAVPPSMGNARSDMEHLFLAILLAASERPCSGLLVSMCMNGRSVVSEK